MAAFDPENKESVDSLISRADQAMYAVKTGTEGGREGRHG